MSIKKPFILISILICLITMGCNNSSTPADIAPHTSPPVEGTKSISSSGNTSPAEYPTPIGGTDKAYEQISETLGRMSESFIKRDHLGYAGYNMSPENPRLIEEHTIMLLNAENVPFERYELTIEDATQGWLEWYDNRPVWSNIGVELTYTLEGVPDTTFSEKYYASFLQNLTDPNQDIEGWRLLTLDRISEPFWLRKPVLVARSPHFLIFYHPEGEEQIPLVKTEVEAAYEFLGTQGLGDLAPTYVVYLAEDHEELGRATAQVTPPQIVGVAVASSLFTPEGFKINSPAFYLNRQALKDSPASGWEETIRHEMFHLIFTNDTVPYLPPWVAEGAATYFGGADYESMIAYWLESGQLSQASLVDMTTVLHLNVSDPTNRESSRQYIYVYLLTEYLIETYGQETYLDFYRAYADIPLKEIMEAVPFKEDYQETLFAAQDWATEKLVAEYFGVSLVELEEQFEAWLETR